VASSVGAEAALPRGMMRIRSSKGEQLLVHVSRALALRGAGGGKQLSADRTVRIISTAALSASISVAPENSEDLRWLVTSNSVCAVRYVDTVYFGSVVRFGFKSKSGMITDMYKPVSLQQGRRAKGLVFMFAWFRAVTGTSDSFVYTGDSTLYEGTATLSCIVQYLCDDYTGSPGRSCH
jgi:hypothetical protein